jgi:DNA invertase Pin-like site-specific DNA recombinase
VAATSARCVSTDARETHLQMDALKYAKCTRVYQEKASGAKAERPELMKLLDNARKGDVVIVWKLDRLARSLRQLIDTTVLLNERGIELHSLTKNINTTTPSRKLTFHIFAALAEFERDILRQRINAGLKAARRRGRVGGRPKALNDAFFAERGVTGVIVLAGRTAHRVSCGPQLKHNPARTAEGARRA